VGGIGVGAVNLKDMVRGWLAYVSVVTPLGDPVYESVRVRYTCLGAFFLPWR
jgi:hypothetical protein